MKTLSSPRSPLAYLAVAVALGSTALAGLGAAGCGGGTPAPQSAKVTPGGSKDPSQWPKDDRTMCDWRNKPEFEVSETAGTGALKPNIRRVFKTFGEGETRHKTLVCREVDTNLDGIKDDVRTFNEKGEALKEEADTDYDGRIDLWLAFVAGRLAEENVDTNHDGKPDVWKVYTNGQLSRIKRDRNFDGRPDVWEIYARGKLERMGLDETNDGHVDRWDRDELVRAELDDEERKAREKLGQSVEPSAAPGQDAFIKDAGAPPSTGKPASSVAPSAPKKKK
ncbi:hypothetical protein [Pendulispora albinea]|uniref:Lipoprotein n=1 Tax=Pendulispora albinea TaxID=2741071 RepID=A0ABZ2LJY4_9BACT